MNQFGKNKAELVLRQMIEDDMKIIIDEVMEVANTKTHRELFNYVLEKNEEVRDKENYRSALILSLLTYVSQDLKPRIEEVANAIYPSDKCDFCGGHGYITVAGNHDIPCKECNK
jgi:uncharacterized membrane protein